jgi:hypothetical protein
MMSDADSTAHHDMSQMDHDMTPAMDSTVDHSMHDMSDDAMSHYTHHEPSS